MRLTSADCETRRSVSLGPRPPGGLSLNGSPRARTPPRVPQTTACIKCYLARHLYRYCKRASSCTSDTYSCFSLGAPLNVIASGSAVTVRSRVQACGRRARFLFVALGRSFSAQPTMAAGAVVLMVIITFAIAAPHARRFGSPPAKPLGALQTPSWSHIFGTDELGRDAYSRVVYGRAGTLSDHWGCCPRSSRSSLGAPRALRQVSSDGSQTA